MVVSLLYGGISRDEEGRSNQTFKKASGIFNAVISVPRKPARPIQPLHEEANGRAGPSSEDISNAREQRKRSAAILFIGCKERFVRRMARRLRNDGMDYIETIGDDVEKLKSILESTEEAKPDIVVLGPEVIGGGLPKTNTFGIINYLTSVARVKVIAVARGGVDYSSLVRYGVSEIISENARPYEFSQRIILILSRGREGRDEELIVEPKLESRIVCPFRDDALETEEGRVNRVIDTMTNFARDVQRGIGGGSSNVYDAHWIVTGHDATWAYICSKLRNLIRERLEIVDFGCGTAYGVAEHLIRRSILFDIIGGQRTAPLRYFGIDNTRKMLENAERGFSDLEGRPEFTAAHIKLGKLPVEVHLIQANIADVKPGLLRALNFAGTNTVFLVSYVAHWVDDTIAFIKGLAEIAPKGCILVSIEEGKGGKSSRTSGGGVMITPSPFMSQHMAEALRRDIKPIDLGRYYKLLEENGFRAIQDQTIEAGIDENPNHRMTGKPFERI